MTSSSSASNSSSGREPLPDDPATTYAELFRDVQEQHVFADQKTFVDCLPKLPAAEILARYRARPTGTDLAAFVTEHFLVPEAPNLKAFAAESLEHHLETLWDMLRREPHPVPGGSSLLPLSHPYIIPGGRFREIYYWDSYFTMLGLRVSKREGLIRAMADNCADLLARFGVIPNGNRSYYLSRSHPPLFAAMVRMIAEQDGAHAYLRYLPALEAELAYWNDQIHPTRHRVAHASAGTLHRYYDRDETARPEAYAHDHKAQPTSGQAAPDYFRNMRSAAESGWDFSSRWFVDGEDIRATQTTRIVPVDLNCFLLQLEETTQHACHLAGREADANRLAAAVARRQEAIRTAFWSDADGYFFDLDAPSGARRQTLTLAGVVPLFVRVATQPQADAVAEMLRRRFLQPGGLVTTLVASGEQWDWPNGWAPLQWLAVAGLRHYGHSRLADEIARRWLQLNRDIFVRTGRLMEKYNVVDLTLRAGGGEYPTQDGFGWTNAVFVRLAQDLAR
jgi:alpha,alpha-trehalase